MQKRHETNRWRAIFFLGTNPRAQKPWKTHASFRKKNAEYVCWLVELSSTIDSMVSWYISSYQTLPTNYQAVSRFRCACCTAARTSGGASWPPSCASHKGSNECPDQTEMTSGEKPELMHQWIVLGFEQIPSEFPVLHMPNIGRIGRCDILKVLARHSSHFKIMDLMYAWVVSI